jgi:hypothetical protein
MRTELNVITGEITEHKDAPVTWEVPIEIVVQPTKEQLLAELQALTAKINSL